jgi:glyoxylase-like metal-dependent hydrolase (beta-lactamase superfamily II)
VADHTIRVGEARITSVTDGHIHFQLSDFFPSIDPSEWTPYRDQLTDEGLIRMNVGSFVVTLGGHTCLIDTGLGEGDHPFDNSEWGLLAADMADKGIAREDVDTVVISHLHRDHVGWNTVSSDGDLVPYFPNARYLVPKADWDTFTRRAGMSMFAYIREKVMSLMDVGVLELIDGEQAIADHLTALPTPGHTPGHTSVLITSSGESAVVLGDAAHVPVQAHHTDWSPRADTNPKLSRASRAGLFDRMEEEHSLVVSGHFPTPGFGRLVRVEGRRYWQAL